MNITMKSYEIYGKRYDCYFYDTGCEQGVTVFNAKGNILFKFNERINEDQIVYLLKGYRINPLKQGATGFD